MRASSLQVPQPNTAIRCRKDPLSVSIRAQDQSTVAARSPLRSPKDRSLNRTTTRTTTRTTPLLPVTTQTPVAILAVNRAVRVGATSQRRQELDLALRQVPAQAPTVTPAVADSPQAPTTALRETTAEGFGASPKSWRT